MHYIHLLRPLQWLKNGFVFAPIFFSSNLLKWEFFWPTLIVFMAFCLISSAIYCFNDLRDVESDRQHPKKRLRPIASGAVSVRSGYAMMIICTIGAFALLPLAQSVNTPYLFLVMAIYWLMNVAYCLWLKQYALIDVTIIAIGFVMRVLIGGLATDIWISHWLVLMTFLVTLFLAFTKRNDDYRIYEQTGQKARVSIDLHQRGDGHHRLCDTGVLHYVHHVGGGHYPYGYPIRLSDERLGTGWHAALPAEHDCLRTERQSHEVACQGPFHPVLHRGLDRLVLRDHLSSLRRSYFTPKR